MGTYDFKNMFFRIVNGSCKQVCYILGRSLHAFLGSALPFSEDLESSLVVRSFWRRWKGIFCTLFAFSSLCWFSYLKRVFCPSCFVLPPRSYCMLLNIKLHSCHFCFEPEEQGKVDALSVLMSAGGKNFVLLIEDEVAILFVFL